MANTSNIYEQAWLFGSVPSDTTATRTVIGTTETDWTRITTAVAPLRSPRFDRHE